MVEAVRWRGFERLMDKVVDKFFAEPVEMYPRTGASAATESEPDTSRKIIKITGILASPGAAVTGEGSSGFAARTLAVGTWLSVQEDQLVEAKLETWREGDHVYFPDRNEWYTVLYATPSPTARPNVELARMQQQPT